jgi:hypothetical protein
MKKFIFVLVIALALCAGAFAQTGDGFTLFSFDLGVAANATIDGGTLVIDNFFALNFKLADPLTVSFFRTSGTLPGTALLVKVGFLPQIKAVLGYGTGFTFANIPDAVIGFEYTPFSQSTNGLATEFKLGVKYVGAFADFFRTAAGTPGPARWFFDMGLGIGF